MRRISPREAHALMSEGYRYLDVRTRAEFDAGHPVGAINVPWQLPEGEGMRENPTFLDDVRTALGEGRLIVGCATGVRSQAAAVKLEGAGFHEVVEQRAGMNGVRDPFGRIKERGWRDEGLPSAP